MAMFDFQIYTYKINDLPHPKEYLINASEDLYEMEIPDLKHETLNCLYQS
jgi:hypothetical protein